MGIGVDRLDYTKGILERFLAIERFLEKYPRYQGVFTFVQIGAPSRTHIKRYHDLQAEVEAEADRINWRFQSDRWKPIVLLNRHHSHKEIEPYYRAADLCLVTSLHDGMNLVAKEFVATRQDERGVLILSCFTGAARELRDALQVNPYDIDQTAEAIRAALEMQPEEKQMRMQRMRKQVREHNVYRWAGSLIGELCEVRLEIAEVGDSNFGREPPRDRSLLRQTAQANAQRTTEAHDGKCSRNASDGRRRSRFTSILRSICLRIGRQRAATLCRIVARTANLSGRFHLSAHVSHAAGASFHPAGILQRLRALEPFGLQRAGC